MTASLNERYDVVDLVGSGAQGSVLRVRDRADGAVRVLKAVTGARDEASARAVIAEFAHLAGLDHPSLPRVHDLGVIASGPMAAGTVFFTAELVDGIPLLDAVARAGADRDRLLWAVARDLASALATLHGAGLLHHDLCPRNVLVVGAGAEARAVLIDLGLAAPPGFDVARGTLAYLAPEALAGGAEARSDLYALGATLHHAAAGVAPFGGSDLTALVRAIAERPPPPLPDLPAALAALIARLLAKDPERRFASASALASALDDIAAAIAPPPRPRPAVNRALGAPPLVGVEPAIASIAASLDERDGPAVWLTGPHGARATDVVAAAVRRHQLGQVTRGLGAAPVIRGGLDEVGRAIGASPGPQGLVAALARGGSAVLLDLTGDDRAAPLARLLAAAGPLPATVIAWQETDAPAPVPAGLRAIRLAPLGVDELAALAAGMLGGPVPRRWAESLARVSGGLAGLAAEVIRAAAGRGDPLAIDPAEVSADADGIAAVAAARIDELDAPERELVRAVAIRPGARAAVGVA